MTGLSGALLTSATGASVQLMPTEPVSAASAPETARVRLGSSTTPSAYGPGTGEPTAANSRVTSPPSSSVAISTSDRSARSAAVSRPS